MTEMINQIKKAFEENKVPCEVLTVGDGWQILVSQHGGHVYGPFSTAYPEGIFWYPQDIADPAALRRIIEKRSWNTGGDRVWISPEIQFNITDRSRFRETLRQPETMDPGYYAMMRRGETVLLHQMLSLPSYNTVEGEMFFDFRRTILAAPDPLRHVSEHDDLMDGVSYCGYEQVMDLTARSEQEMFAESWDLLQIRPEGTLYIPMYVPVRGTDHYEPAAEMETLVRGGVCLKINGQRRYKIAYPSSALTGRFGYLADADGENTYLVVINYPNNPSCMYAEEPPLRPGDRGYSIHIYNDDGTSGGFAEMECNLQTIGRPTGLDRSIDRVTKWIYSGKKEQVQQIAGYLLGYDFSQDNGGRKS